MSDDLQCAVCEKSASEPGLMFLGKRWYFCSQPCRISFKRQPEHWIALNPHAGVGFESASALPRTRTVSPFKLR